MTPPADLAETHDAYVKGLLGLPASPRSPRARTRTIDGPGGPIALRIFVPDEVRGVYLHVHGGGWIAGSNDTWDAQIELFGREAGMVAVSFDYRLAPEHPAPSAIDDSVAVASWLIEHSQKEFDTSWLSIGGESAGANLAVLALLRLREQGRGTHFVQQVFCSAASIFHSRPVYSRHKARLSSVWRPCASSSQRLPAPSI